MGKVKQQKNDNVPDNERQVDEIMPIDANEEQGEQENNPQDGEEKVGGKFVPDHIPTIKKGVTKIYAQNIAERRSIRKIAVNVLKERLIEERTRTLDPLRTEVKKFIVLVKKNQKRKV